MIGNVNKFWFFFATKQILFYLIHFDSIDVQITTHTHFTSNNYIVILQPQNANRSDNNYIKTVLKSTLKLSPCSRKSSFNSNIRIIIHIDILSPAI